MPHASDAQSSFGHHTIEKKLTRPQRSLSLPHFWPPERNRVELSEASPETQTWYSLLTLPLMANFPTIPDPFKPASVPSTPLTSVQPLENIQKASTLSDRTRTQHKDPPRHIPITPPLTPSSTIRTRGSTDADASVSGEGEGSEVPLEDNASRFLLIANVPKTTSPDALKTAFLSAAARSPTNEEDTAPSCFPSFLSSQPSFCSSSIFSSLNINSDATSCNHQYPNQNLNIIPDDSPIKGVYMRYRDSHAIVILAFYDSRDAAHAQRALSANGGNIFSAEGLEGPQKDPGQRITCTVVSMDDVRKMAGQSTFVDWTHGEFYLLTEEVLAPSPDSAIQNGKKKDLGDAGQENSVQRKREFESKMKSFMDAFGDLRSFRALDPKVDKIPVELEGKGSPVFSVDFCDARHADEAYSHLLSGMVIFGMKLKVYGRDWITITSHGVDELKRSERVTPLAIDTNCVPFPSQLNHDPGLQSNTAMETESYRQKARQSFHRPRSVSAGNGDLPSHNSYAQNSNSPQIMYRSPASSQSIIGGSNANAQSLQDPYGRRRSNQLFFDAVGKPKGPFVYPETEAVASGSYLEGRSIEPGVVVEGLEQAEWEYPFADDPAHFMYGPHQECRYCPSRGAGCAARLAPMPLSDPCVTPSTPSFISSSLSPHSTLPSPLSVYDYGHQALRSPVYECPTTPNDYWIQQPTVYSPPMQPVPHSFFQPNVPTLNDNPPLRYLPQPNHTSPISPINMSAPPRETAVPPERNQLNLERIEDGQDTRTTVMIKNIPNKMTDQDLIAYIGSVCPRRIDFLYLRMDFKNGCNVGYAFVNFITVEDLLTFAKSKLGVKWNMFSSFKVLQMSYANYQGKEALVEKFKNSCIMDEKEAWRPKIFYSNPGPSQGLPEPFPEPTHLRRKERSSQNRGDLFSTRPGVSYVQEHSSQSRRFR